MWRVISAENGPAILIEPDKMLHLSGNPHATFGGQFWLLFLSPVWAFISPSLPCWTGVRNSCCSLPLSFSSPCSNLSFINVVLLGVMLPKLTQATLKSQTSVDFNSIPVLAWFGGSQPTASLPLRLLAPNLTGAAWSQPFYLITPLHPCLKTSEKGRKISRRFCFICLFVLELRDYLLLL